MMERYDYILESFVKILNVSGKRFNQRNKSYFGISDARDGVQWNLAIYPDEHEARLGINLEGKEYSNWPIATFILAELENPTIFELKSRIPGHRQVYIRFKRDAWQGPSRLSIEEAILGGKEPTISSIKPSVWRSILEEALSCLNKEKEYRGRAKQEVTLVSKNNGNGKKETKWVTPHLTIWTPIGLDSDPEAEMELAIKEMTTVHRWLSNRVNTKILST